MVALITQITSARDASSGHARIYPFGLAGLGCEKFEPETARLRYAGAHLWRGYARLGTRKSTYLRGYASWGA